MRITAGRALTLAAVLATAVLTGCYRRVVSAEGPGTAGYDVYEPNLKDERVPIADDVADALLGEKGSSAESRP